MHAVAIPIDALTNSGSGYNLLTVVYYIILKAASESIEYSVTKNN